MYFNRADVREALHVQAVQEEAGFWLGLNPRVATAYTYDITSVIPQHEFLISRGEPCSLWYTSSTCLGYNSKTLGDGLQRVIRSTHVCLSEH